MNLRPFRCLRIGVFASLIAILGPIGFANIALGADPNRISLNLVGAGVNLDATLYLPSKTPAPAILLAHGFGGSKDSVVTEARTLQSRGYVVLAWTARGFGKSTGTISMNSPTAEVADVSKLIDYLATRQEVIQDRPTDPRVGITGGSYGGAISLLAAGYDPRIDAVAADITWNNLENALFPQSAINVNQPGPFKRVWTGTFFSIGSLGYAKPPTQPEALRPETLLCGRFAPQWCSAYQASVAASAPSPEISTLMHASSPSSIAARIQVPTLLMQGEADSLFPLSESALTANEIRQAQPKLPLAMIWHGGGHDGGLDESKRLNSQVGNWFDIYLKHEKKTFPTFQVTDSAAAISLQDSAAAPRVFMSQTLPMDAAFRQVAIKGATRILIAPAGAVPAAVSSLPGFGSALSLAGGLGAFLPGQSAFFDSAPISKPLTIVGSSRVQVKVTSTAPDATLFFSLVVRSASGRITQPAGLVAPIRLTNIPPSGTVVDIALPSIVTNVAPGDRVALAVSTTDLGYSMPNQGRVYGVQVLSSDLSIPTLSLHTAPGRTSLFLWPLIALLVIALAVLWVFLMKPRQKHSAQGQLANAATPLVEFINLAKQYGDGYQAVKNLSFTVERGQVLGLLGPNGAGKTTTLRMLMGLILPSEGSMAIDGKPVYPGAPALALVGSFVEGPGFLPHLSGRQNLDLYWRSIGRSEDPEMADALEISGLGSAVDKKVRTYSHGMRQRLAIAQAMLGKPDLLVLDEPTNGLDPTQIKAMRDVLRNYAASGRTVIVSSHLLSEVEQTCSHVVVMHRGQMIAHGTIEEILNRNGKRAQHLEDIFMELVGTDTEIGL
jgi:ABC-2 type transport system ATP-binding protein